MECEVVRRLFTDHIPSTAATVGGIGLPRSRSGPGLYGGPTSCHHAARRGRLPLFEAMGQPARRIDCRIGERLSWVRELPGLLRGSVGHDVRRPNLPECPSISL